jgi:flavin-binding protein dodecin
MVEKTITLTGVSANSIQDAISLAVARAAVTIEGIRRVHVVDVDGDVENGAVVNWRVKVQITFTVQDRLHE